MATPSIIDIGEDFSRFPVGRYLDDGDSNGQRFREEKLMPALVKSEIVIVKLDSALGYGSSFLEEAFGGLIRAGYKKNDLLRKLQIETADDSLKTEILQYITEADEIGR